MKKFLQFLPIICLIFYSSKTFTQQEVTSFPIKISILDETLTLPGLGSLNYKFNPAIMLGTEYILRKKNNHDWFLSANLGYYYHKDWQAAVFINSEIGYRYQFKRWNFNSKFGLGYAHAFSTKPLYENKEGVWQEAKNTGSPKFMPSIGFELGYQLTDEINSPEIFATYMLAIDVPTNIFSGFHRLAGIGIKFYPLN